jgi:hypothetical protein
MTRVTQTGLYSFHKEIACYYFKILNEAFLIGIADRNCKIAENNLVGFWKIKKMKS